MRLFNALGRCGGSYDIYARFEKECQTLQKAAKGYADAMKGTVAVSDSIFPAPLSYGRAAMTATQGRLADTIDVFYSAADKASEAAMAAHAYKRAIDDLDTGIGRELVRPASHTLCATSCRTPVATARKHRIARRSWSL